MLRRPAAKHRFQIREIRDIDDLIDAKSKRAHWIVGGETMGQQHNKMLPAIGTGVDTELSQHRVCAEGRAPEILVNDHHMIGVGAQF